MHIINAYFESLDELPVTALFGAIGVYVLWSARADVRPSYIGEGNLIHRFANEHVDRFGRNTTGYAAIMTEGTARARKSDAEILEAVLLAIGHRIDQCPVNNDSSGKRKGIGKHYETGHNVIRLNISGYHPLRWNTRINGAQQIQLRLARREDGLEMDLTHPWRLRT